MDYSSSVHDTDNPVGASPWGSSPTPSPRHSRTTFGHSGGDAPPSPSPYRENRASNGSFEGSLDLNRPDSSGLVSGADHGPDPQRLDTGSGIQTRPEQPGFTRNPQQQYNQAQGRQQEYSPVSPDQERQTPIISSRRGPGPVHKLQAKITGLERTGRKDPILRFDVYVREFS
jgi:hypothetical protein